MLEIYGWIVEGLSVQASEVPRRKKKTLSCLYSLWNKCQSQSQNASPKLYGVRPYDSDETLPLILL